MNRYILDPEDRIRVLPPHDGAEAALESGKSSLTATARRWRLQRMQE